VQQDWEGLVKLIKDPMLVGSLGYVGWRGPGWRVMHIKGLHENKSLGES